MTRIIAAGAAGIALVVTAWTVLASHLFVWIGGLWAHFPWPLTTWWRYARHPIIDGKTAIYLAASAVLAAIPIVLIILAVVLGLRSGSRQPDLWGTTWFATRREMDRGGIKTRGKLF